MVRTQLGHVLFVLTMRSELAGKVRLDVPVGRVRTLWRVRTLGQSRTLTHFVLPPTCQGVGRTSRTHTYRCVLMSYPGVGHLTAWRNGRGSIAWRALP